MPRVDCVNQVELVQTARTLQLAGLFDIPPSQRSERRFSVEVPLEEPYHVGLIVGPSGSGKSTLARQAFGPHLLQGFDWPADRSLVDGFPAGMSIKEITGLLSSVGFSSPPSWLQPFHTLSNGEQFRATLARAMAESPDLAVIDEFSSVVDRQVAQIGSAAVAKSVRRAGRKLIAVSCHYDIEDWLDPDWIIEMPEGTLTRRSVRRRPVIELEIVRAHRKAWSIFKHHHYLNGSLAHASKCFVALLNDEPVAFASALNTPSGSGSYWREHRTVCRPDYQGVGIGNGLSEFVASVMKATGRRYYSTTGNPAMMRHRAASPLWRMCRKPSLKMRDRRSPRGMNTAASRAVHRLTAGFEFVGPANVEEAKRLGIIT